MGHASKTATMAMYYIRNILFNYIYSLKINSYKIMLHSPALMISESPVTSTSRLPV